MKVAAAGVLLLAAALLIAWNVGLFASGSKPLTDAEKADRPHPRGGANLAGEPK
jgi:hypothetical protein